MQKQYLLALLTCVLILGVLFFVPQPEQILVTPTESVATTTQVVNECNHDGKICSDGSVVGRVGEKCEFPECPSPDATSATIRTTIGQKMTGLNVTLTPLEVVDDSRCPVDAQCIWAGTVKVNTRVVSGLGTSEMVFELNQPITTEAEVITLTEVTPIRTAGEAIPTSLYRFAYTVSKPQTGLK